MIKKIDDVDAKILSTLVEDSRTPFVKIAQELPIRVQDTTIRKRVFNLRDRGIIEKFTLLLDPEKINIQLNALMIEALPGYTEDIVSHLKTIKAVSQIFTTSDGRLFCFIARENETEEASLLKEISELHGLKNITILPNVRVRKYDSIIPSSIIKKISR